MILLIALLFMRYLLIKFNIMPCKQKDNGFIFNRLMLVSYAILYLIFEREGLVYVAAQEAVLTACAYALVKLLQEIYSAIHAKIGVN